MTLLLNLQKRPDYRRKTLRDPRKPLSRANFSKTVLWWHHWNRVAQGQKQLENLCDGTVRKRLTFTCWMGLWVNRKPDLEWNYKNCIRHCQHLRHHHLASFLPKWHSVLSWTHEARCQYPSSSIEVHHGQARLFIFVGWCYHSCAYLSRGIPEGIRLKCRSDNNRYIHGHGHMWELVLCINTCVVPQSSVDDTWKESCTCAVGFWEKPDEKYWSGWVYGKVCQQFTPNSSAAV